MTEWLWFMLLTPCLWRRNVSTPVCKEEIEMQEKVKVVSVEEA